MSTSNSQCVIELTRNIVSISIPIRRFESWLESFWRGQAKPQWPSLGERSKPKPESPRREGDVYNNESIRLGSMML